MSAYQQHRDRFPATGHIPAHLTGQSLSLGLCESSFLLLEYFIEYLIECGTGVPTDTDRSDPGSLIEDRGPLVPYHL